MIPTPREQALTEFLSKQRMNLMMTDPQSIQVRKAIHINLAVEFHLNRIGVVLDDPREEEPDDE